MKKITRPILLIEDNPMDADLTRRAFVKRKLVNPFDVLRDGEEALIYIKRWKADTPLPVVILLDLKLPKVDGLEVLRQMKAHPQFCTVPVVILTTTSEDSDIETAYQLGANSYIIKPVDFEKFMKVAEQVELYWNVLNRPPN
jgi:CheY-like chemotaxis protein